MSVHPGACVKTPPLRNLGGRLTLGEVEKIAPSAIWRLDISSHSTRSGFSHGLPGKRTLDNHIGEQMISICTYGPLHSGYMPTNAQGNEKGI